MKFNSDTKSQLIELLNADYPSVKQIFDKIPTLVLRSEKSMTETVTAVTLVIDSTNESKNNVNNSYKRSNTYKCRFCQKMHPSKFCNMSTTRIDRTEILKKCEHLFLSKKNTYAI